MGRFGTELETQYFSRRNDLDPQCRSRILSGLTIEAAENRIRQELGKIMATLDGSQPNTFVSVGLGQIRSIKVNIVGEAVAPGPIHSHLSPRFSTPFMQQEE